MIYLVLLVEIVTGAFILFTIARATYGKFSPERLWVWVLILLVMMVICFFIHRKIGNSINPPFLTALFFITTLQGMSIVNGKTGPDEVNPRWRKRGIIAAFIGSAIGWLLYTENCVINNGVTTCSSVL